MSSPASSQLTSHQSSQMECPVWWPFCYRVTFYDVFTLTKKKLKVYYWLRCRPGSCLALLYKQRRLWWICQISIQNEACKICDTFHHLHLYDFKRYDVLYFFKIHVLFVIKYTVFGSSLKAIINDWYETRTFSRQENDCHAMFFCAFQVLVWKVSLWFTCHFARDCP